MKKMGTSFSMCVRDIVQGKIKIEDVEFIITQTAYPSHEIMMSSSEVIFAGRDLFGALDVVRILWYSGRIYQPSVRFGDHVMSARRNTARWIDIPEVFEPRV